MMESILNRRADGAQQPHATAEHLERVYAARVVDADEGERQLPFRVVRLLVDRVTDGCRRLAFPICGRQQQAAYS